MKALRPIALGSLFLLAACGGTEATSTVTGDDPASLRNAPAGLASLSIIDLLSLRPSTATPAAAIQPMGAQPAVAPSIIGPACMSVTANGGVVTYAFSGTCVAANGGTLTGGVDVTTSASAGTVTNVMLYKPLVATLSGVTWTYAGTMTLAVSGQTATLQTTPGFTIAQAGGQSNKTWTLTTNLSADWTSGLYRLTGGYALATAAGESATISIDPEHPLTWAASGSYPVSGAFTLSYVNPAIPSTLQHPVTLEVSFGNGTITIAGGTLTLGQS